MADLFTAARAPGDNSPASGPPEQVEKTSLRRWLGFAASLILVVITVALASVAGRWGGFVLVVGGIAAAVAAAGLPGSFASAIRWTGGLGATLIVIPACIWFAVYADHGVPRESGDEAAVVDAERQAAESFLTAARREASFPDPDYVLVGVGESICFELVHDGVSQMRGNLARSSFTSASRKLCWTLR